MGQILRVFVRRTSHTPNDPYTWVGPPGLWMPPDVGQVHINCVFTWDLPQARILQQAWSAVHPNVLLGGPALGSPVDGFVAGKYVKLGVTFTSRGCDNSCPWCLVPQIEGRFRVLDQVTPGWIIQDNNLLQAPAAHRHQVYRMLAKQPHKAVFAGGLQPRLITDTVADELRGVRIRRLFLAADTDGAIKQVAAAVRRLQWLPRWRLQCYVLVGFDGDTVDAARGRLQQLWDVGVTPFAQLYQPAGLRRLDYGPDWRRLVKQWCRPGLTKQIIKGGTGDGPI